MSSRYRVEFELVGNAGNIEAVLNRLNNGISRVGGSSRQASNEMGLWQRQMMAMGTTARYALAGGVVFGVTAAVGALSQFERKMGQIMAIMGDLGSSRGFDQASRDIQSLGDYALNASIRLNTGVEQIQDSMQIFYSSFDVPAGQRGLQQVQSFSDAMTKLAAVSEATDFETLANGVIGFSQALGRGRPDIEKYANEIAAFTRESLGIRGDVLAQGIGNLGATARVGGFTGEQSLALLGAAAQGGGSPAVSMRGVAQLQRVILRPTTPAQIAAYRAVGLPTDPVQLSRMGGLAVLQRMLSGVRQRGGLAAVGGMSEDQIAQATSAGEAGVTGGGAGIAFNLFGRAEALRAFTTIYSQQGKHKDFDYFLQQITDAGQNMTTLNEQFRAFLSQSTLSNVSNAFHAASIQAVRSLDPILHPVAGLVTGALGAATAHPRATMAVEAALFASLGARALNRFIPGRFGRVLGRFGRVAGIGAGAAGGALTGEAAANLLGGGHTDGTRANPFWVIIHPASAYVGSGGGYGPLGGPETPLPGSRVPRIPRIPLAPIGAVGAVAAGALLGGYGIYRFTHGVMHRGADTPLANAFLQHATVDRSSPFAAKYPGLRNLFQQYSDAGGAMSIQQLESRLAGNPAALGFAGWRRIQTRGEQVAAQRAVQSVRERTGVVADAFAVEGNLSGDFTIHLVDKQGNEIGVVEHKGVPTKLWGARAVPQHRGKPKDTRKGR